MRCELCGTHLTPKQMFFCSVECRDDYQVRIASFRSQHGEKADGYYRELGERLDRALFDIHHL